MRQVDPIVEGARVLAVCNACRYCEQYCPVFKAMERRLDFASADVNYLANLCHNCGECLYACQYAPPHEFAINVPQALAGARGDVFLSFGSRRPGAGFRLQRAIGESGFVIQRLVPNFNEYVGAGVLGGTSHLYHLSATPALRALVPERFEAPLYTADVLEPRTGARYG